MRRYLLSAWCCVISGVAFAQYVPNNSQAFQFINLYNPAFSGIEPFTDIKLGYRYQWAGIEGAPKALNLSINTRTKQPLDLVYNTPRSSNLNLKIPKKKLMLHGLGVNVFSTTYGQIKTVGGALNYSLHFAVSRKLRAAVGVGAILNNTKLSMEGLTVREPINDAYYNSLLQNGSTTTELNVRAGALLYSRNFYFGFSYLPVFQKALQSTDLSLTKPFYRGSAQLGVSLPVNTVVDIKPSVVAMVQMNNSVTMDYTIKAYMRDLLWFGFSYRSVQSGVALFGLNVNQTFGFAYSYEMSLSKFKQFNGGSHEMVLAIRLNNFKHQEQYTW